MNLGADEIYNLLHNNQPISVAHHIRDVATNVAGSLILLDHIVEAKRVHEKEISEGGAFSVLFSRYLTGLDKKSGMPSLPKRAKHLSKAIFRFVVAGFPVATKADAERKLAICETDECGFFDGSICTHTKCGCFAKIKTFFETESCPIDKW